ncbi:tRNA (adenosine(37)-N6)-threonylcarbamoyltransferase complex dimerization subunit type 1 TsaB [Piscinibacter sakaiensis]|uniref:tRNA (adenosine(37)-N6)-threonylcarbamoyltransferase complex dimerization subunit type 1 TsaB n=1 Tax=Piscinibacter sakaiensis TaxID=1547922 RepID=UPI003AADF091
MNDVETGPAPARPCRLLAIDTATEKTSLVLVTPQSMLAIEGDGGAQASARLLADLQLLLERAGCRLADLDAIGFGCGPGAFTGIRTACSVAQGLAFGAGKPVLAIDSLMLVAEGARAELLAIGADTVWVLQDARMDEIYAAAYRWQGESEQRWQTLVAPALYAVDAWNASFGTAPAGALAGSALSVMGSRLAGGDVPRIGAGDGSGSGRAQALGRLAVAQFSDGRLLDAAQAVPLYLRDKVALTTAEREAARAAKAA